LTIPHKKTVQWPWKYLDKSSVICPSTWGNNSIDSSYATVHLLLGNHVVCNVRKWYSDIKWKCDKVWARQLCYLKPTNRWERGLPKQLLWKERDENFLIMV
jgi:hypothetical protein